MYFLTDTALHCILASLTILSGALKTSRAILLREKDPPAQEFKTLQYEKQQRITHTDLLPYFGLKKRTAPGVINSTRCP